MQTDHGSHEVRRRETDDVRDQLSAVPPGVLYALAASRLAAARDWRDRGAALLLQAAADQQVMRAEP
jgi:hypothetical protein